MGNTEIEKSFTIGQILQQCHDVPPELGKILVMHGNRNLYRLMQSLRNIRNEPCGFEHEFSPNISVTTCKASNTNPACGHGGDDAVGARFNHKNLKHYSAISPAPAIGIVVNPENALASIMRALVLVMALGNHNDEARQLMGELEHCGYGLADFDNIATSLPRKCLPAHEMIAERQKLTDQQKIIGDRIMPICDRVLAMLEEEIPNLTNPDYERGRSAQLPISDLILSGSPINRKREKF